MDYETKTKLEKQASDSLEYGNDLVYNVRQWEKLQYDWARNEHNALRNCELSGTEKTSAYATFQREQFSRLIGKVSKLEDSAPEASWANKIHSALDELPEWETLRERCRNDEYASACATAGLSSRTLSMLPNFEHDAQEQRTLKELLEDDRDNGELSNPEALTQAEEGYQKALEEIDSIANNLDMSELRQAMRQSIETTNKELDDIDNAMCCAGWGTDHSNTQTRVGAEMKAQVAKALRDSHKLSAILEMAGRMQNIWKDVKATKPSRGSSELTDIETGNDLARLLPSESVALNHPGMKLALWRKLSERSALQYKLEAKKAENKGPVIVCIDDSGSMRGDREVWAKGLALGLMLMARDQNRAFAYCSFSRSLNTTATESEAKRLSPVELLQTLEQFHGGGTAFEPPMDWSLGLIKSTGSLKKADIILISDGACLHHDVDGLRSEVDSLEARIWGLAVGHEAISETREGSMQSFCEKVWPVSQAVPSKANTEESEAIRGIMSV